MASVGAAVGLGNALRFPGLCAKYGGGTFLFIYLIALIVMGIPILNAEIALGRKVRGGAPKCMARLAPRAEPVGWSACFNSLTVAVVYAGALGWIIAMLVKIVPLCSSAQTMSRAEVGGYFFTEVLGGAISPLLVGTIIFAWTVMYLCLRGGAKSLAGTAKFTVIAPITLLMFLAVRGMLYSNSGEALYALFVPDFAAFGDIELWLNALGQVFFSLSILAGIMPAYGAYLPEGTNIFRDSVIIACADFFVSALSSVVLFTTLYGCGLQSEISRSGIITAFAVYPVAITRAFGVGSAFNAVIGVLFYLSLAMMAVQSSVSMIEAALNPLSEKFGIKKKKLAAIVCSAGAAVCLVFATDEAVAAQDIADHFANYFNILFLGIAECIVIGRGAKSIGLAGEINRYTGRVKMPEKLFIFSVKYLCPIVLTFLVACGLFRLFFADGGRYGDYEWWEQAVFGWSVSLAVFSSGFAIKLLTRRKSRVEPRPARRAGKVKNRAF